MTAFHGANYSNLSSANYLQKNFVYKKICKNFHNYTRLQQTIGLYNLNGIFRRNSCKYIFTFKLILVKLM